MEWRVGGGKVIADQHSADGQPNWMNSGGPRHCSRIRTSSELLMDKESGYGTGRSGRELVIRRGAGEGGQQKRCVGEKRVGMMVS